MKETKQEKINKLKAMIERSIEVYNKEYDLEYTKIEARWEELKQQPDHYDWASKNPTGVDLWWEDQVSFTAEQAMKEAFQSTYLDWDTFEYLFHCLTHDQESQICWECYID